MKTLRSCYLAVPTTTLPSEAKLCEALLVKVTTSLKEFKQFYLAEKNLGDMTNAIVI